MIDSADYWNDKYIKGDVPWDMGKSSPIFEHFIKKNPEAKSKKILIPGAGNGWDAYSLFSNGFKNTYLLDWSEKACQNFTDQFPDFPKEQIICSDFFALKDYFFDIIIEQTFFCALPPTSRSEYVEKISELLNPDGVLCGVLFNFPLTEKGPPFGGNGEEYQKLFEGDFELLEMVDCHFSHPARLGKELSIKFQKK